MRKDTLARSECFKKEKKQNSGANKIEEHSEQRQRNREIIVASGVDETVKKK